MPTCWTCEAVAGQADAVTVARVLDATEAVAPLEPRIARPREAFSWTRRKKFANALSRGRIVAWAEEKLSRV